MVQFLSQRKKERAGVASDTSPEAQQRPQPIGARKKFILWRVGPNDSVHEFDSNHSAWRSCADIEFQAGSLVQLYEEVTSEEKGYPVSMCSAPHIKRQHYT
jgi:hypothetical protein